MIQLTHHLSKDELKEEAINLENYVFLSIWC